MFNETQEKFLAALESGNYKQGIGRLRYGDKFCILGVVCDVYDSSRWNGKNYSGESACVHSDVKSALRLRNSWGGFDFYKVNGWYNLIELNDKGKVSFKDIAALIRRCPWLVFINFQSSDVLPIVINKLEIKHA